MVMLKNWVFCGTGKAVKKYKWHPKRIWLFTVPPSFWLMPLMHMGGSRWLEKEFLLLTNSYPISHRRDWVLLPFKMGVTQYPHFKTKTKPQKAVWQISLYYSCISVPSLKVLNYLIWVTDYTEPLFLVAVQVGGLQKVIVSRCLLSVGM